MRFIYEYQSSTIKTLHSQRRFPSARVKFKRKTRPKISLCARQFFFVRRIMPTLCEPEHKSGRKGGIPADECVDSVLLVLVVLFVRHLAHLSTKARTVIFKRSATKVPI